MPAPLLASARPHELPIDFLTLKIIESSSLDTSPSFLLRGQALGEPALIEAQESFSIELIPITSSSPVFMSSAESTIAALQRMDVHTQTQFAQQLCEIITQKGHRVRPELLRVEGSKVQLFIYTGATSVGEGEDPILQALNEMKDSFKSLPSFCITALNARADYNDRGIENPVELDKLKAFKFLLTNTHASKQERMDLYASLHPRIKELFQFLVWASNKKPMHWHADFSRFLVELEPCILNDTNGFQKQALIDQVIGIVTLIQKAHETKNTLIKLKQLFSEATDGAAIFAFLYPETDDGEDRYLPLFEPLRAKIGTFFRDGMLRDLIVPENLKRVAPLILALKSPNSALSMFDELLYVLQLMREELTVDAIREKCIHFDSYTHEQFPARHTSRACVDAKRFQHVLPTDSRFRAVMVTYELAIWAVKYGGLGEAVYGLANALVDSGVEVSLIVPKFDVLTIPDRLGRVKLGLDKQPLFNEADEGAFFSHFYDGGVKVDRYFHKEPRPGLHLYYLSEEDPVPGKEHYVIGNDASIYLDIPEDPREKWMGLKERIAYFSSASIGLINYLNQRLGSFDAGVIHDWHGAVALRNLVPTEMGLVYAVHNHHYQGELFDVSAEIAQKCGGPKEGMNVFLEALEMVGHLVPVSLTYALECQIYASGAGVDGPMRKVAHEGRITGIANGSNPAGWDPATHAHLKEWRILRRGEDGRPELSGDVGSINYSSESPDILDKKRFIKEQLQLAIEYYYPDIHEKYRINITPEGMLYLFVGRYETKQKGLDKFLPAYRTINELGGCFITMGIGEDEEATELFDALEEEVIERGNAWISRGKNDAFSLNMQLGRILDKPPLGAIIRAAADFVLFPSSFEPCGLVQFEAWLFGALAIGTSTGGLADTFMTDQKSLNFNGFTFPRLPKWKTEEQTRCFTDSIREAHTYWSSLSDEEKTPILHRMMIHAQNSSWTKTPDGSKSPVHKWIDVMIEAKRHTWMQRSRIGNPPLQDSLITSMLTSKRDGFYPDRRLYNRFGAHLVQSGPCSSSSSSQTVPSDGVRFRVLAPNARSVEVLIHGKYEEKIVRMEPSSSEEGVWEIDVKGIGEGSAYEYLVEMSTGQIVRKSDPFAVETLLRPQYASVVRSPSTFPWTDGAWLSARIDKRLGEFPLSIFQVELGSYQRNEDLTFKNYRELAPRLVAHCQTMGYTHVELLGILEHPLDEMIDNGISGLFSCTSRFGSLADFQSLVNTLHENHIGVVLNWAPFDFVPNDESLGRFDGQPLYENPDPINGIAPYGRKTHLFNFRRQDVRNFVISAALYACEHWHVDGFRLNTARLLIDLKQGKVDHVQRVESYRPEMPDGSSKNPHGIQFLAEFNQAVMEHFPGVFRIAENFESPQLRISREELGFDALTSHLAEPGRQIIPAFSHSWKQDRVHQFGVTNLANTKLLLSTLMLSPGWGYILFMGIDYGREEPWDPRTVLNLVESSNEQHHDHVGMMVTELNQIYRSSSAFWKSTGYAPYKTSAHNITAYHRGNAADRYLVVHNHNPHPFEEFLLPEAIKYVEIFNTDLQNFGGGSSRNHAVVTTALRIAPLSTVLLQQIA